MKDKVSYLHSEIDVPADNNPNLESINSDKQPELTRENFARLCQKVTEIREKWQPKINELEQRLDDLDQRLTKIEMDLDVEEIRNIRGDIEDVARVISTIKTEAADFQPNLESDIPF